MLGSFVDVRVLYVEDIFVFMYLEGGYEYVFFFYSFVVYIIYVFI